MLAKLFPCISYKGVYSFLDNQGLLNSRLTRNNNKIHLSPRGISLYVAHMKRHVFQTRKTSQLLKPTTGVSTTDRSPGGHVT